MSSKARAKQHLRPLDDARDDDDIQNTGRNALIGASRPLPAWKRCCPNELRCIFVFNDPDMERRYGFFMISARRLLVTLSSGSVGVYSVVRFGFTAVNMQETAAFNLAAADMTPFFTLMLSSQALLFCIVAAAGVLVNFSAARRRWPTISKALLSVLFALHQPLLWVTNLVGMLGSANLTIDLDSPNVTHADGDGLTVKSSVDDSIIENSMLMVLAPLIGLILCAPARFHATMLWVFFTVAVVPNFLLPFFAGTSEYITYDDHTILATDRASRVARFIISVWVVLMVSLRMVVSFDSVVRSTFLLRHLVQQEKNVLSSLANPFAPNQLEKWYQEKQRHFALEQQDSQARARTDGQALTQAWDLNADDLHIEETIATGGGGSVLAATYNGLNVAVKVLHSSASEGLLEELSREVSALHRIRHGFILQFYGLTVLRTLEGHERGAIAIVTERCDGNLRGWMRAPHALTEKLTATLQVLRGMSYLHRDCGLVHRDLKPENVLVDRLSNRCKICDFGLSLSGVTSEESGGTLPYMAPESLRGLSSRRRLAPAVPAEAPGAPVEREAFAADVYSMGIMTWEVFSDAELYGDTADWNRDLAQYVLSGGRPDLAEVTAHVSVAAKREAAAEGVPELDAAVGQRISEWIARMWANAPLTRPSFYQVAQAFDPLRAMWLMRQPHLQQE